MLQSDIINKKENFILNKREASPSLQHMHREFELIAVTEGSMEITVFEKHYTLQKQDAVLIFPNQAHSLTNVKNGKHITCDFSYILVNHFFQKYQNLVPVNSIFKLSPMYIELLQRLNEESSTDFAKGVLYLICSEFEKSTEFVQQKKQLDSEALVTKICAFVKENYNHNCSLYDLEKNFSYSYVYLSKCFKQTSGISYNNYVNNYRIDKACELLTNTNKSVLDISSEVGYTSLRTFNRNFKQITGLSPKDYRATPPIFQKLKPNII